MTQVFISYSRKDKFFAEKLHSALSSIALESWIDWIDIPPVADWKEQIYKGIEAADGFLFLLSPDSVKSVICGEEIDHAVKNGKRLIPLVVRDINANDVHAALTKLNWIFFREQDDFALSLKKLEAGIKTDLVWVEAHRRMQIRALEWEKRNDRSLLLRGKDLREAEEKLASAGQKDPQPTDLQRQYVLESRRGETRTRNSILATGAIVIVGLVLLSIFAFSQRNTAIANDNARATAQADSENQKATAIANFEIANSGDLSSQAKTLRDTNLPLSFLLGIESFNIQDNYRTRGALLENITTHPKLESFLYGHSSRVKAVLFLDNQNKIASAGCKVINSITGDCSVGELLLWDLSKEIPTHKIFEGHKDWIFALAYNSATNIIASGGNDSQIILWDAATGNKVGQPLIYHSNAVVSLSFDANSNLLASGDYSGHLIVWDIQNNKEVLNHFNNDFNGPISGLTFSPDGNFLAFSLCNNYRDVEAIKCEGEKISVWDIDNNIIIDFEDSENNHNNIIKSLAFSPDGEIIASGGNDGRINLWDANTHKRLSNPLVGHLDWIYSLSFIDDDTLASGSTDNTIIIWDVSDVSNVILSETWTGHTGWVNSIAVSINKKTLAAASEDGSISLWNLDEIYSSENIVSSHDGLVSSLAISPDQKLMISGGFDGSLAIWDTEFYRKIKEVPVEINKSRISVGSVAISANGMFATGHGGGILIWDSASLSYQKLLAFPENSGILRLSFSSDGNYLASSSFIDQGTILMIWDISSGEKIFESDIRDDPSSDSIIFNPINNDMFAFADENNNLNLWNLSTKINIFPPLSGHLDVIGSIAFSPDGNMVASASYGKIILWDVNVGKQIGLPLTSTEIGLGTIGSMAFSPDGNLLATNGCGIEEACTEPQVRLWDVKSHQLIGNVRSGKTQPHWIFPPILTFDTDGQTLISGGCKQYDANDNCVEGQVIFWDVSPQSWIEKSCERAGRNLTYDEWSQYFPNDEYRMTCPQWKSGNELQQFDSAPVSTPTEQGATARR
jgi:WD40 repeat protein